jgi:choline kinase
MTDGAEVLLMDADMLYDARIAKALVAGQRPVNRVLIDRDFESGEEPVKVCIRDGVPIELRKKLDADLQYDNIGESVGFFSIESVRGATTRGNRRLLRGAGGRSLTARGGHS